MYKLDRKRTLVWVAVVVLLGYAFFNFYSENQALETEAEPTMLEQLAGRVSNLETQIMQLQEELAALQASAEPEATESTTEDTTPEATVAVVSAQYLNVRAEPSIDSLKVGVLTRDAEVTVLETQGDWSKVHFKNEKHELTGWVSSEFISAKE